MRLIALRLPEEAIRRRKKRAKREVERRPRSKGVQRCGRRRKRGAGAQPVRAAFVASTISGARTRPRGVCTNPSPTRTTGEPSWSAIPSASTARLSARTSSAGWTFAPSRKNPALCTR